MSLVRIYQGRVTRTEFCEPDQAGLFTGDLTSLGHPLWQHHAVFQQAINYYLVAIAALADTRQADVLTKLRERVIAEWDGGARARGQVNGFGSSIAPLLGLAAKSDIEAVFSAILPPTPQLTEARHLAGLLLLEKCQGDSGIQQGGRNFFPLFCEPETKMRFPLSLEARQKSQGQSRLPHLLYNVDSHTEISALRAKLNFGLFANAVPDGRLIQGAEAKLKLAEAVAWLAQKHETIGASKVRLNAAVEALPDSVCFPAYTGGSINKDILKQRFFAFLVFTLVEQSRSIFEVLRNSYTQPQKTLDDAQSHMSDHDSGKFAALGDDPIKLARSSCGYVFRAFTSLSTLWPHEGEKDGCPHWSEFDKAAFKEALKAVNQFRLKTEERTSRKDKLQTQLDYQCARVAVRPKPDAATKDGDEAESLVRLGDDPRFKKLQVVIDSLAQSTENPEEGYTVSRASLRGWSDLRRDWLALRKAGAQESDQAAFDQAVTSWQTAHRDGAGDQRLFRELAKPGNHIVWLPPEPIPGDTHDRAEDVLRAAAQLFEDEEEVEQLATPVRLTPADPVVSPRQFMLSDPTGRHAAKRISADQWEITAAARASNSAIFSLVKLRLHFSAPRLHRDQLDGIGEAATIRWLPPMLMGLLGDSASNHAPTLAKDPALGLMPEFDRRSLAPCVKRVLLNFPVTLESEALSAHVGRASHWRHQFNRIGRGEEETLLHLLWPGMKNAPTDSPWWRDPAGLTVLSIDLGQRAAAAAAVIELRADGKFSAKRMPLPFSLGRTDNHGWQAAVQTARHLRLPGEDRALEAHENIPGLEVERSGKSGRLSSIGEWNDACELARDLGEGDPIKRLGGQNKPDDYKRFSFPEQNDELLRLARSAANQLRRLHGLSWRITNPDKSSDALVELQADPELTCHIGADNSATATALAGTFRRSRERYCSLLEQLANRVVPLREQRWAWIPRPDSPGQPWRQLARVAAPTDEFSARAKLAGQRGLSLSRVEQWRICGGVFFRLTGCLNSLPACRIPVPSGASASRLSLALTCLKRSTA